MSSQSIHYLRPTKPVSCKKFNLFPRRMIADEWIDVQNNELLTLLLLVALALGVLLGNQRVKFLLLLRRQQRSNLSTRFLSWLFETWPQLCAQRAIFITCLVENRADRLCLIVSQIQIATHLFEAIVRSIPIAASHSVIETGYGPAGERSQHKDHHQHEPYFYCCVTLHCY